MSISYSENIIVVGGTSEIGLAITKALIKRGAKVTVIGRNIDKLTAMFSDFGDELHYFSCDLSQEQERKKILQESIKITGLFTGIIYVAGYHRLMPIGPSYSSSLTEHLKINVEAPLDLIQIFINKKISNDKYQRSITILSSVAHLLGEPALSAYGASKGAIVSAVRSLAVELARKNIRINTVSPGWIEGESATKVRKQISEESRDHILSNYPLGFGAPEDVAEAVSFISSPCAKWITGTDLIVDGGRSVV